MTAIQMTRRQYVPAAIRFISEIGASLAVAGKLGTVQKDLLEQVSRHLDAAAKKVAKLEDEAKKAQAIDKVEKQAAAYRDKVMAAAVSLRTEIDALESILPADLWPVPTYSEMLFKL
jgi:glutamine synthetase